LSLEITIKFLKMKTRVLGLAALFMLVAVSVFAASKTGKIEVKGNCGMCESRIEKTVKGIDGVSKADWDKTTKKLEVTFDDTKTSVDKIEVAVAKWSRYPVGKSYRRCV